MVDIEAIAKDVVNCAIKVHKTLGPGLLESAYQYCHAYELRKRGWIAETEVKLPLHYEDQEIDVGYRIDTLINNLVIVENEAIESILPVHEAQLLTYLKLSGCKIGFLLNWNVVLMKNGIKRFVPNLPGEGPFPKKPSSLK
ncbi:MAG TPA: GxxExxY protein [Anaerolineales bacterium]|nr:GxxExxY protein [Anaerolineales bacterium]